MAVADFVGARLVGGSFSNRGFTEFHAASTEIREFTMDDTIALTAARKLQPVIAKIRKRAVFEYTFVNAFSPDGTRHTDSCLGETANLDMLRRGGLIPVTRREIPFRMRKFETFHGHAFDELSLFRLAFQAQDLSEHWCDGFD